MSEHLRGAYVLASDYDALAERLVQAEANVFDWQTSDAVATARAEAAEALVAEALDALRTLRDLSWNHKPGSPEHRLVGDDNRETEYNKRWRAAYSATDAILNRKATP